MFIYDIEIQNAIPPKNPADRISGIEYCEGWHDYKNMKIAVIGAYDYTTDKYHIFGEKDLEQFTVFAALHDVAVGFNNLNFDNNLLAANGVIMSEKTSYDILFEISRKTGTFKGYGLENCVKANFPNTAKSGNGATAPIDWQRGNQTKIINYCLNDVRITKMLLDKIIRFGYINSPIKSGEIITLRRP